MPSRLALLCLAALCGVAAASRPDLFDATGDAGRHLLQTSADCEASVTNCQQCRYVFYRGTVTRAICTQCKTKHQVAPGGRACWCASGYYLSGGVCTDCGVDGYCVGAKSTPTADRVACGTNKKTATSLAKSDRECLAKAGYGWASGDAVACVAGTYNPGDNNRRCTRCPGGLTTTATLKTAPTDCMAPKGYYYLRGKAVACPRGAWKDQIANTDCTECPTGVITDSALGVAREAKTDCTHVVAGYYMTASFVVGETNATQCPADKWRSGELALASATACTDCNANMKTLPGLLGASSANQCLAPPGYGYSTTAGADATYGTAAVCGDGNYKAGYNREACKACGNADYHTDTTTATSVDECYINAGYGAYQKDDSTWNAYQCPANTYGVDEKTYGQVAVECTKCMENTHTQGNAGQVNVTACVTQPGYGFDNGAVNICPYGTYNEGNNLLPCTSCGAGYNTTNSTADPATGTPTTGAIALNQCAIAAGWTLNGTNIKPCEQGYYKQVLGEGACTKCPSGTTTTVSEAAVELSDCDACRPGFGGSISDLENPSCTICGTGYYSTGGVSGGLACATCPTPTNGYTGNMVSRQGTSNADDCVQQFSSDETNSDNLLAWDYIEMPTNALVNVTAGDATLSACQTQCRGDNTCIYFVYQTSWCQHLKAAAAITAQPTGFPDDSAWVLLEVKAGRYAVYKVTSGSESIGTQIAASYTTYTDAKDACDANPACIGFNKIVGGNWRTFQGSLSEFAMAKIKVYGETINPWVAEPTAN